MPNLQDKKSKFLLVLFFINFFGSIYGFYWYKAQLLSTFPEYLRIFVPDSPTASSLFSLALLLIIIKKPSPFVSLLASCWVIKYGLWAAVINTHFLLTGEGYSFTNFHLTLSHLGMAIEGFLLISKCSFSKIHFFLVVILMISSDIIDYTLGIYPWLFAENQQTVALVSAVLLTAFISFYCFIRLRTQTRK
ncbi:DUF1405 domain-containing protein [Tepidanaerobacter syntrophicus]|uniref:Uncharacterized membrane protein YpjA n=1 Tax=Tepidanaerobacter syntrophicus TaxID=224999 RepID=A0A0U9HKW7_9FIRM|nr:uncharacterized membrane protein YpjA [Tepidanaerobacter syntrophicus]